jgi:hypothetical protein
MSLAPPTFVFQRMRQGGAMPMMIAELMVVMEVPADMLPAC